MAFAHVQTKQQSPTAATRALAVTSLSETFAATPSVGNLVVVFLTLFNSGGTDTLTSVTDNQGGGNIWTIVPTRPNAVATGSHVSIVAYSTLAVASGTFTVTANYSASSDVDIGISEWSGAPQSVRVATSSATGTGTSYAAGSVTPSAVGDLFVSVICDNDNAQTYTAPGGWAKRSENADGVNAMVISSASLIAASLAAQAATWTATTSATWAALNVVFLTVPAPVHWSPLAPKMVGKPTPGNQFRSPKAYLVPDPPPPLGSASFWRLTGPLVGFGRKGSPFTGIVPRRAYVVPATTGVDLAGSIGGAAAFGGDIAIAAALAGAIAGATTPTLAVALAEALAGSIAGTTALPGAASLAEALQGSLAGTAALSGSLTLIEPLQGAIGGTTALTGALSEAVALQGVIAGTTTLPGNLTLAVALAGSIGGAAALSGNLQTGTPLAGSIGGASAGTGRLSEAIALAGAIAGASAFTTEAPAAPPAAPTSTRRTSGGRPVIRIEERVERVAALARTVHSKAPRAHSAPSSATAGSTAPALAAIATLRTASGSASGAGVARTRASVMLLTAQRAGGSGVHNPPDDAPLMLAMFYPQFRLAKAARGVKPIDRERHAILHAEAAIKAHVHSFLHMLALRLSAIARGRHVHKAAGADDEVKAAAEAADFDQLENEVAPYLRAAAKDGARTALVQVASNATDEMLSLVNQRAVEWANDHAGVLIQGIATTTREKVAAIIATASEEGWSNDTLADELQQSGAFSEARAEMVARTESAFADVQGNLVGWRESGVVEGRVWRVGAGCCDECEELDGEEVAIDEEFAEGDPPLHPNCRCDVLPVLAEE